MLGNALRLLGTRENGTARLEEAVAAYREALDDALAAMEGWRNFVKQRRLI